MPPKVISKGNKTRSHKKTSPELKKNAQKKSSPVKSKSKPHTIPKAPKNKRRIETLSSVSCTPDPGSASIEENKISKKDDQLITPKLMKYCLNAYKQSPAYDDLKKKRFNTSFRNEIPRGYRDIQIFPSEEEDSPMWSKNLPLDEDKIQGEPGDKYANIFLSIPGLSDSDEDVKEVKVKETKSKGARKKGRKKMIGYKGLPFPDECLLTDYTSLLYSSD